LATEPVTGTAVSEFFLAQASLTSMGRSTKVRGLHEDATLVFATEFFNLFNHPQFANPTGSQTDVSKSTFGQITSASVNPRLIRFALEYVF
jgi:hypothetical protein